jgi:3-oxoacyl-[acyl-carrier-protein] synthase-3
MFLGTGSAVSDNVLTNYDLEKMVDTSNEWIKERSGIERRHILEDGKVNSDLAVLAAERALDDAGLSPKEIDYIILGTATPDYIFPSTACQVQAKIGMDNAAAFDISAACSGFLYGLIIGDNFIQNNPEKKVLVIGSEVLSRITDWEDRTTCVLFGDGAGAVVLGQSNGIKGILSEYMKSNGCLTDLLYMPGGGTKIVSSHESIDQHMHYIKMKGKEVFKHAVKAMADAATKALKLAGRKPEELSLLIPHQANIRIINAIAERLKLPKEKVFVNLQEYGNTSAASIPIAIDQARKEGVLKEGDLCLLVAFGGGFTWASNLVQF